MSDYQLNNQELAQLRETHRRLKRNGDGKQMDRVKAVYLLGSGWDVSSVCEALLCDENTIYRYHELYKIGNVKALLENRYKGSEKQLTDGEVEELSEHLESHPCQTTKQVAAHIESEYEVTYSTSGMNSLLKNLGFVYKKPRIIPGKFDAKQQALFLKMYRKTRDLMSKGDSLFFMDGVHPHHNPIVQYGWFKKGSKQPLKTNSQNHRVNITGAVDIDRLEVITQESKQLNEESTLDFLEKLRKKRPTGRLYLVLDNAGYYNTNGVRDFAKAIGIDLLFLPPYSPNLNVIERLWRLLKKDVLYNHYYPSFDEFKKACFDFLKGLRWRKDELKTLLTEKFERLPC